MSELIIDERTKLLAALQGDIEKRIGDLKNPNDPEDVYRTTPAVVLTGRDSALAIICTNAEPDVAYNRCGDGGKVVVLPREEGKYLAHRNEGQSFTLVVNDNRRSIAVYIGLDSFKQALELDQNVINNACVLFSDSDGLPSILSQLDDVVPNIIEQTYSDYESLPK